MQAALGLRAPILVRRDLHVAHAVELAALAPGVDADGEVPYRARVRWPGHRHASARYSGL